VLPSMQHVRADGHLPHTPRSSFSCTRASVAELRRHTLAPDEDHAPAGARSAAASLLHPWKAVDRFAIAFHVQASGSASTRVVDVPISSKLGTSTRAGSLLPLDGGGVDGPFHGDGLDGDAVGHGDREALDLAESEGAVERQAGER